MPLSPFLKIRKAVVFHSCFTAGLAFYVIKESRYPNI